MDALVARHLLVGAGVGIEEETVQNVLAHNVLACHNGPSVPRVTNAEGARHVHIYRRLFAIQELDGLDDAVGVEVEGVRVAFRPIHDACRRVDGFLAPPPRKVVELA